MAITMDDVKGSVRRDRAARTRRAIVAAATEEFCASGYQGTTMAAIARRAGVAVQTVYFVFHTKPQLLTTAIDLAVMGDEEPTPPHLSPWWQEGTTTASGRRAIELFVAGVAAIEERAAPLSRAAAAAAATEPEVAAVLDHHEELRVAGFREYVDSMANRGLLRTGLDPADATDVLLTLVGSEVFLAFTDGRKWSVGRYVRWSTDSLGAMLLAPDAAG